MKLQYKVGYLIVIIFVLLALIKGNYEFIIYAAATAVLLGLIHWSDKKFQYNKWVLWGFDLWMVSHILGGLLVVGGVALYSVMLVPIVGEPYSIFKYDQLVHMFCYFIVSLLMWSIVTKISSKKVSFGLLAFIAIMAASGIGGLNEIIEFSTTLFFDNNVGGYENTAIDIVSNLLGGLIAIPFMKKIGRK